jgi:hypothetical protein
MDVYIRASGCLLRFASLPVILTVVLTSAGAAQGVAVDPGEVTSGLFYTGATVRVSAVVPSGAQVAMVYRSEDHPLVLKRKGRALGVVWMNVGHVSFGSVPDVYLLRTSVPVDSLAPPSELRDRGVGFGALAARCEPDSGAGGLFDDLVRLKERDRVWGVAEGSVRVQPAEGGFALATTDFSLPVRAKPGTYRIFVYTFAEGRGTLLGSADVQLKEGGISSFITSLAKRHGLLYGVLAALIAMAMGLLTGLVFGLGSKH